MALRDDIIADCQAAWFDTDGLAQAVTYTPKGGSGVSTQAVVYYGNDPASQGRYLLEKMEALVPQQDVPAPAPGDTLTVGAATWTVRQVKGGDSLGVGWTLECTKSERPTQREARG